MSKLICSSAIDGAIAWVAKAEGKLDEAVAAKGESYAVGFPDTAYFLPVIYSFSGEKMQTLADLRRILKRAKELLPARPSDKLWPPCSPARSSRPANTSLGPNPWTASGWVPPMTSSCASAA